jgi:uncharacterized membrane protein YbhN (UPF0104 family)
VIGLAVGLLLSGAALYLALRNLDLGLVLQELLAADLLYLVLALVVVGLANVFRALRWQVLLAHQPVPALRVCFTSMMIGYLVNNIVPARLGELVRIYVLDCRTGIGKSRSAPSIIVERVIDGLLLLALAALFVPLPEAIAGAGWLAGAGFVAGAAVLAALALRGHLIVGLTTRLADRVSPGAGRWAGDAAARFIEGIRSLCQGGRALPTFISTLLVWVTELAGVALVARALDLPLGPSALLLVLVLVSLSFLVPAAPGGLGVYELAVMVALSAFVVDEHRALSFALVLHLVTYLSSMIQGVAALWVERLSWHDLLQSARASRSGSQNRPLGT